MRLRRSRTVAPSFIRLFPHTADLDAAVVSKPPTVPNEGLGRRWNGSVSFESGRRCPQVTHRAARYLPGVRHGPPIMPAMHFRDELVTGLPTGPWLASQATLMRASLETQAWAALVVLDIDHLRYFNWLESFAEGDNALRDVADWLRRTALPGDLVARISGGEFAMLRGVASSAEAAGFTQTLRQDIAELLRPRVSPAVQAAFDELIASNCNVQQPAQLLTACVGVVSFPAGDERSFESLLSEARARVGAAKRAGRNRVWAEPAPPDVECE